MKNTINAWLFLLFAVGFGVWELMHHWWFWVGLAVVVGLIWLHFYNEGAARRDHAARIAARPQWTPPLGREQLAEPRPRPKMVIHDDYVEIHDFMDNGHWDAARKVLQRIAYSMVDEAPEIKARFTALMTDFAVRDPLLAGVLRVVMPIVREQPGILQTAVYKHLPGIVVEDARYALYFAEQLGILRREKKGNSYRLLPAGEMIALQST